MIEWLLDKTAKVADLGGNIGLLFDIFPELLTAMHLGAAEAFISIGGVLLGSVAPFLALLEAWLSGDERARYNGAVQGWSWAMASMAMRQPPCLTGRVPPYTLPSDSDLARDYGIPDTVAGREAIRGWHEGAAQARQAMRSLERNRRGLGELYLYFLRRKLGGFDSIRDYWKRRMPFR